jgi:hypothetical protein
MQGILLACFKGTLPGRFTMLHASRRSRFLALPLLALLLVFSSNALAGNLVVNGGFETGDFTGWTQWGDTSLTSVYSDVSPYVTGGSHAASFGNSVLGGILQDLVTIPSVTYILSFSLHAEKTDNGSYTPSNIFKVEFDGNTIVDENNIPNFDPSLSDWIWTQYTFSVTPGSGLSSLKFSFQNEPSFFQIDDISVTTAVTPEPGTLALMGIGALGAAFMRKRMRRRGE